MPDPQQHLRPEERENYEAVCEMLKTSTNRSIPDMDFLTDQKKALENLAACRALLKKHEWGYDDESVCLECLNAKSDGHHPDCAIAAQLAGIGEE